MNGRLYCAVLANGLDWIGLGLRPEVEYGYQVTMRGGCVAERLRSSIVQRAAVRAIGVGQGSCFASAFGSSGGAGPGNGDAHLKRRRIV